MGMMLQEHSECIPRHIALMRKCRLENESEKGSPKSAFRALETASFAMKGRDKREQWILFANEHSLDDRQEMARPRKDLRQTAKRPILSNFEHRFKQARVTTVKQISAGGE
ncbi:hypothetical protein ALC57_17257 [Trachymyrmex cornetzi]|uniref:Uncharacterized protein n=1 Tax=Trachymyrmex cornetzi TaxID=471704 RepID=A0A195DCP1_9HYME|nr:hypothetical protein ALC57_17257 [Trachymyrmex cornetzi]